MTTWRVGKVSVLLGATAVASLVVPSGAGAAPPRQPVGTVVQATIPEAIGGKVVIGNLAVDEQGGEGFVTAYPCDQPRPLKSDLNALAGPPQSNRFIGLADANGRICFQSNVATSLVFDANAVLANVVTFPNRRTDTRGGAPVAAGGVLEVLVPEAVGGKVVVGNLAVDQQTQPGFVTGYPCDQPKPLASDLNFFFRGATSNRFIGQASADGRICLSPSVAAHLVFDVSAILPDAAPFGARRFDTRGFRRVTPTEPLDVFLPEAIGGKTVIGNLATDRQNGAGYVTAYPCSEARPVASDLNFVGSFLATSNRFVGRADAAGHLCFHSSVVTDIVFDATATLGGVTSFTNRRTDTRLGPAPPGCTTSQLGARAEPVPPVTPIATMNVWVTNTGPTCELGGFPAVSGVTADDETIQLAAGHFGGFAQQIHALATIAQGETLLGLMAGGSSCPPGTPDPTETWTSYVLQFPLGAAVRVPALVEPTCFLAVSQFGTPSSVPVIPLPQNTLVPT